MIPKNRVPGMVPKIAIYGAAAVLDDHRIEITIKWLCERFEEFYPWIRIQPEFSLYEHDLSEELKVIIFVQEALNNAGKHSHSPSVLVALSRNGAGVELRVEDDGKGFKVDEARGNGLGLSSMRERVELTRGIFMIRSSPGNGTKIKAVWQVLRSGT